MLCKNLTDVLCPTIERERHYAKFERQKMLPGENPTVFRYIFKLSWTIIVSNKGRRRPSNATIVVDKYTWRENVGAGEQLVVT